MPESAVIAAMVQIAVSIPNASAMTSARIAPTAKPPSRQSRQDPDGSRAPARVGDVTSRDRSFGL
jgi:hypothetical protein